jgi:hypothetical protein
MLSSVELVTVICLEVQRDSLYSGGGSEERATADCRGTQSWDLRNLYRNSGLIKHSEAEDTTAELPSEGKHWTKSRGRPLTATAVSHSKESDEMERIWKEVIVNCRDWGNPWKPWVTTAGPSRGLYPSTSKIPLDNLLRTSWSWADVHLETKCSRDL